MDFEIPYFKKQAEKMQHQLVDQEHKHEDYLRSADAATREYSQVLTPVLSLLLVHMSFLIILVFCFVHFKYSCACMVMQILRCRAADCCHNQLDSIGDVTIRAAQLHRQTTHKQPDPHVLLTGVCSSWH